MRETLYALALAARFDDAGWLGVAGPSSSTPSARHRLRPPHSERLASTGLVAYGVNIWLGAGPRPPSGLSKRPPMASRRGVPPRVT